MSKPTCPALSDWFAENNCVENLAGLDNGLYAFIKSDLAAPLTFTEGSENVYSTPTFKAGKRLYKIEAKEHSVQHKDSSLGKRKGFKQELTYTVDADNAKTTVLNRALNNNEIGFIYTDNGESYVVYDPNRNGSFESDGISGATGAAPSDDRQTTYTYVLQPTIYGKTMITVPEEGWDSLCKEPTGN